MKANRSRKVLVIEDETNWQLLIARSLQKSDPGTEVRFAKSTSQAAKLLHSERDFDLILADQYLEGDATGLDLWNELSRQNREIPYIILSSLERKDFIDCVSGYKNPSAPYYFKKPTLPSTLYGSLEKMITSAIGSSAQTATPSLIPEKDLLFWRRFSWMCWLGLFVFGIWVTSQLLTIKVTLT